MRKQVNWIFVVLVVLAVSLVTWADSRIANTTRKPDPLPTPPTTEQKEKLYGEVNFRDIRAMEKRIKALEDKIDHYNMLGDKAVRLPGVLK
jgi:nitric oxide reductase large subunit